MQERNQFNSKRNKKKKKDIMDKKVKICFEKVIEICLNQAKGTKTSCNHLLKVRYLT